MALQLRDSNNAIQRLPIWVDPVFRFAGSIAATDVAGTANDFLLITAASTGVTRLHKARFRLVGGGTATSAGGVAVTMNRVTAAPTGQTNAPVTGYAHDPSDGSPGSTVNVTPNTSQTAGTVAKVLGAEAIALSLLGDNGGGGVGDLLQAVDLFFPTGTKKAQKPVIIPAGGFLTFRAATALPASSVLYFDLMISEATS
jgi:hypothetical protein